VSRARDCDEEKGQVQDAADNKARHGNDNQAKTIHATAVEEALVYHGREQGNPYDRGCQDA
jgi:hypothetical protein